MQIKANSTTLTTRKVIIRNGKSTSLELELFGSYLLSLRRNYTWTITAASSLSLSLSLLAAGANSDTAQ
jgi:hypothetical protein